MSTLGTVIVGLIAGFVAGIVVSEIIGIVGMVVFDEVVGIKFLSIVLAALGAVAAPTVAGRLRRRSS